MTLLKCEQTRPKRDQSNPNFKYSDQKPSRSELSFGLSDPSNPNLAHDHQILILLWKKPALHRHELVIVFSRFSLNETTKTTKQRVSPGYIYNESHNHEILYVFLVPRECHVSASTREHRKFLLTVRELTVRWRKFRRTIESWKSWWLCRREQDSEVFWIIGSLVHA